MFYTLQTKFIKSLIYPMTLQSYCSSITFCCCGDVNHKFVKSYINFLENYFLFLFPMLFITPLIKSSSAPYNAYAEMHSFFSEELVLDMVVFFIVFY